MDVNILNQELNNFIFSKMIKTKNKTFFFDIFINKKGDKILKIVKSKKSSNGSQKEIILKEKEIDLLINVLKEIKPLFDNSFLS